MLNHVALKENVQEVFRKCNGRVLFAYLFGSAARNALTPLSDVDIAVFLSEDSKESHFETRLSLYADLSRALKRNDIDVVVLNTTFNLILLEEIVRYGVVVYDTDTELRDDFELKVLHQAIDFREQRSAVMGI